MVKDNIGTNEHMNTTIMTVRGVNNYVNENSNKTEHKCVERLLFYTKTIFMI